MTNPGDALVATVIEILPRSRYRVRSADGRELTALLSPRCIADSFAPGQEVSIELSPYDPSMCRIVPNDDGKTITILQFR